MTDRKELQDNMIQQILEDMDIKTMMAILYDNMSESYDKYSDEELITEVKEYYPELLEEWSSVPVEALSTKPPTDPHRVPYYVHQGEGDRPHTH